MKIVDKYLLRTFLLPFVYCLAAFTVLYVVIDLFANLDEILKSKTDIDIIVYYYMLFVPLIFVQTTPIAVLLSTLYSLGNLNRHNEIIAMRSSGMSLLRIIYPLLFFGLILSLTVFTVNDKLVPKSAKISSKIKKQHIDKAPNLKGSSAFYNIALYGANNMIIYAGAIDISKNQMSDIIIYKQNEDQGIQSKISAKSGQWDERRWTFYDVLMYNVDSSGKITGQPKYLHESAMDIEESPNELANKEWRVEFMNFSELCAYIKKFSGASSKTLAGFKVELYNKLAFPLTSLLIILVGATFALRAGRGGALMGVGMAVIISFTYYGITALSLALGKAGMLPPFIAAWLSNTIFLALGIYLLKKT